MAKTLYSRGYINQTDGAFETPAWGTVPAGKEWIILSMRCINKNGAATDRAVGVQIVKHSNNGGGTVTVLPNGALCPAMDALDVFDDDQKFVLEALDQIQFYSAENADIEWFVSWKTKDV